MQQASLAKTCIRRVVTQAPRNRHSLRGSPEPRLGVLLPPVAADGLPPHIRAPSDNALGCALRSHGGADIQVEDGLACDLGLTRVVVDNISDLLLLAVDISGNIPIVSVERRLGASKVVRQDSMICQEKRQLTQTWRGRPSPGPASWWPWESGPWVGPGSGRE